VRDENNYRNYNLGVIEHLNAVKACLNVGFTINEVESMILMDSISKEAQTLLLKEKILEVEDAQRKLQQSKHYLQTMLESDVSCEQGLGKTNLN
jgi:MerR family transcriptional regulator, copper efflux regulator